MNVHIVLCTMQVMGQSSWVEAVYPEDALVVATRHAADGTSWAASCRVVTHTVEETYED